MNSKEILETAASIVQKNWTKNAFARNKKGGTVLAESNDGISFCIIGALRHVCKSGVPKRVTEAVYEVTKPHGVMYWNDNKCKSGQEAANVLMEAIKKL